MKEYKRIRAVIDLDAISFNMDSMHKNTRPGTKMIGVIKADGYGHGAVPIAKELEKKDYMWGFAVATFEEAMALRHNKVSLPILILGFPFENGFKELINNEIRMTVFSYQTAKEISDAAVALGKNAYIHIKTDTGMSRIGFRVNEDSVSEIIKISKLPNLTLEGLYTHFSRVDETDKSFTLKQMDSFMFMKNRLKDNGIEFSLCHCSNSATIIDLPDLSMDAVRAGISLYGIYPSDNVRAENVPLKPALSLISHVINVKTVGAGVPVGYGATFVTEGDTKIATIPVGYGDGYPRSLSNCGHVLIKGKLAPIIGRVCMDQLMVDATGIDVSPGDEVTLVGKNNGSEITVDTISELSGRFSYEFVCVLGRRIPREYLKDGQIVLQTDDFH